MIKRGLLEEKFLFLAGLCVFIVMLTLNFLTPYIADDFGRVDTSILEVLKKQYYQYMGHAGGNGRTVSLFLVNAFRMAPKYVYNICNALMFSWLTILIYNLSQSGRKDNLPLYLFINFAIWLYTITYGQVILWMSGALTYLWGMAIILSFFLPYYLYVVKGRPFKQNFISLMGIFLLGVIAGWSNENTSGGLVLSVILLFIYCRIWSVKIQKWMTIGFIGVIIGYCLLLFSPASANRSKAFATGGSVMRDLADRIVIYTNVLQNDLNYLVILFIVLIITQIVTKKDIKRIYLSFLYFTAAIATVYAMVLSPASSTDRAMFGPTIFLIIACAHAFAGLSPKTDTSKIIYVSFTAILAFQSTTSFVNAFYDISKYKILSVQRQKYVMEQAVQGNCNILVPIAPQTKSKYNPQYGLTYEPWYELTTLLNKDWEGITDVSVSGIDYASWKKVYAQGSPQLMGCNDIGEYVELVYKEEYIVFIALSAKTPGALDGELAEALEKLGLSKDMLYSQNYVSVIDSGKIIYERASSELVEFSGNISGLDSIVQCDEQNNTLSILLKGVEYARSKAELNIVVYNKQTKCVADSVTFMITEPFESIR